MTTTAQDFDGASRFVYVESNAAAAPGNMILGYARGDDGTLTPLPGSPYAANGLGVSPTFALGPFDSSQNMITNADNSLLFAVNSGSNSIAVFDIDDDGSLSHVPGSPFNSGGSNPVSVALSGDILCVVNQDVASLGLFLPNYTSFRVTPKGRLIAIRGSTAFVDAGSSPSQALVSPDGGLLFGADFLGGLLRSFKITRNGRLAPRAMQPLPPGEFAGTGAPALPLGLAVHPEKPLLYVGFVTISRVGVYRYSASGALEFLRSVPDSGKAVCWLLCNADGSRLYAANTADNSISVFDLTDDPTKPREIQKVVLKGTSSAFQIALDSSEDFLFVVGQRASAAQPFSANSLHTLKVMPDGTVEEVDSSPLVLPVPQDGSRPQGVLAF